jgi:hypothetical protein
VMVMDGAKAQVEGDFRRKLCDAGCHIKQTEPHTQSSNMGEGAVHELKKGCWKTNDALWMPKAILG